MTGGDDEVVTRGVLREELRVLRDELRADFATKDELRAQLAPFATKDELRADFATKDELRAQLAPFATKEELRAQLARFATKDELRAQLTPFATKDELRAQLAPFATKDELRAQLAPFATKDELRAQLAAFTDAIVDRMTGMEQRLHGDISTWTRSVEEKTAETLRVLDDKYGDLPPRVAKLEAKVFAPRRRRGRS